MGEVVDIQAKQRHISGKLKCLACRHTWIGAAPAGAIDMTCPECECNRGVWFGAIWPNDNNLILKCRSCKGCAFFVVEGGWLSCLVCGDTNTIPES